MADYMAAEIWIGGRVSASLVEDLCDAIDAEGIGLEWGAACFQPKSAVELLEVRRDDGRGVNLLCLCNDEVSYGSFDDLEPFLCEHQIAYRRRSAGKYEHEPCVVEFRPGQSPVEWLANAEGEPVVPAQPLWDVLDTLVAATNEAATPAEIAGSVKTAIKILRQELPPKFSPLESFEIVPDA